MIDIFSRCFVGSSSFVYVERYLMQ